MQDRRSISLYRQMGYPSKAIPCHRSGCKKSQIARPGQQYDKRHRQRRSENMHQTRRRVCMLGQVIRPEIVESIELGFLSHLRRIILSRRKFH